MLLPTLISLLEKANIFGKPRDVLRKIEVETMNGFEEREEEEESAQELEYRDSLRLVSPAIVARQEVFKGTETDYTIPVCR